VWRSLEVEELSVEELSVQPSCFCAHEAMQISGCYHPIPNKNVEDLAKNKNLFFLLGTLLGNFNCKSVVF
jgi:hypothetical protein